jgi:hypothetical protein
MKIALLLFWKDVRQFRIFLGLWFGLLLLDLAVNFGWVGRMSYTYGVGFDQASNTWTGLLPHVLWGFIIVLPSIVVLADSPARREGFLATRPVSGCEVFLAKLLFVLTLIVIPWVLSELIHLAGIGMPRWVISRGICERLLFTLPIAFGFSAFASLWPDVPRWARAIAIIAGIYMVIAVTFNLWAMYVHFDFFAETTSLASPIVNLSVLALGLVVLMFWHAPAHRGVKARWGGLVLVGAVTSIMLHFWPWDTFGLRPLDQSSADTAMDHSGFEIPARSFDVIKVQQQGHHGLQFGVTFVPKVKSLPDNYVVDYVGLDAGLQDNQGVKLTSQHVPSRNVFDSYYYNPSLKSGDFAAWSSAFPSDVLFRDAMNNGISLNSLNFYNLDLPPGTNAMTTPLSAYVSFETRVFQWRKLADLSVAPGAHSTDEFGSWNLLATAPIAKSSGEIFYLERQQVCLDTATDSRCSHVENGPLSRMVYMIYDPVTHVVWMPDYNSQYSQSRAEDSAVPRYYIALTVNFTPAERARCRLIIFEKSWVGTVPKMWSSPSFSLADRLKPYNVRQSYSSQPMPRAEFDRRVAALNRPAPDAPRPDISRYLLEFLRLVSARQRPLTGSDPDVRQLAAFVPAHLDLLLAGLPFMDYASRQTIDAVIALGATEEQKPVIIAALQDCPELAGLLLERGWLADARPQVLQLTQSLHPLPIEALRALIWLHDPQTYPRLLDEFDTNPNADSEAVLRTVPELAPSVDEIIRRHWHQDSLVFYRQNSYLMFNTSFSLALHLGLDSTLQRAYLLLADPGFDHLNIEYYLARGLGQGMQMPGLALAERQNNNAILDWVRLHRPEDFTYNPALRQFVLRSTSTGNSVASRQP